MPAHRVPGCCRQELATRTDKWHGIHRCQMTHDVDHAGLMRPCFACVVMQSVTIINKHAGILVQGVMRAKWVAILHAIQ